MRGHGLTRPFELDLVLRSEAATELARSPAVDVLQVCLRVDAPRTVVVAERRPAYFEGLEVGGRTPAEAAEGALEGVLEGLPEVPVEVGVDNRIQGRVEISDPEKDGHQDVGARASLPTECRYDVPRTNQLRSID